VSSDEAYNDDARIKACQQEIDRFVTNVIAYRACLQHEIERAVLETNTVIDRFKCGMASKRRCP
jgi:hypothetical protein